MQPIHLWLSVYDKQTKKPKRQIQPILPIVILAYRKSFNQNPVIKEAITDLYDQNQLREHYTVQLKEWEKEGYFTIEERRFGTMVSRIFHLDRKASAALQDLKECNNRIELHMVTEDDLHHLAFSALLNNNHAAYRADFPWAQAAEALIIRHRNL